MTRTIVLLILISALATYTPRALPFFSKKLEILPTQMKKMLSYMPLAALGALVFPGIIVDFSQLPIAGLLGITVAALFAWFRKGMVLPIIGSISTAYVLLTYFT